MAGGLLSNTWHLVSGLKPRLSPQASIHRQVQRGRPVYLLQDEASGRLYILTPAANLMLSQMNGRRSLQRLWEIACARHPDDPPRQDEVIGLLGRLHALDLLVAGLPDLAELDRRHVNVQRRQLMQRLRNPLSVRVPLFNPDRFLDALTPLARAVFSPLGALLWLGVVLAGGVTTALEWDALTKGVADDAFAAENLLLMALVYPAVKAVHELAHGLAMKSRGGEVPEVGIMFLVLFPVPYVDASASAAFPDAWRRALVAASGILAELFLAALAILFWASAEPGILRAAAFNVALIAGVSTVFFNGNPLLRFDGYYVLCDLVGIQNLDTRSKRHVIGLIQRRLFGLDDVTPVAADGAEARWMTGYAVLAFLYRLFIALAVALLIAGQLFVVGILLAVWSLTIFAVVPLAKALWWLLTNRRLEGRRMRPLMVVAGSVAATVVLLGMVPLPRTTVAEAVVWNAEASAVRAGTAGFVAEIAARDQPVAIGDIVLRLDDPALSARRAINAAELAEARIRLSALAVTDRAAAQLLSERVRALEEHGAALDLRAEALTIRTARSGRFVLLHDTSLEGRFVEQGRILGHVITGAPPVLRAVVRQDAIDLVRAETRAVSLRFAASPGAEHGAEILQEVPAGRSELPSAAFTPRGGGSVVPDPRDPAGLAALEPVFLFELAVTGAASQGRIGERAWVRFSHDSSPVIERAADAFRRLFLRRFGV